jgi:hypothetical protein
VGCIVDVSEILTVSIFKCSVTHVEVKIICKTFADDFCFGRWHRVEVDYITDVSVIFTPSILKAKMSPCRIVFYFWSFEGSNSYRLQDEDLKTNKYDSYNAGIAQSV